MIMGDDMGDGPDVFAGLVFVRYAKPLEVNEKRESSEEVCVAITVNNMASRQNGEISKFSTEP